MIKRLLLYFNGFVNGVAFGFALAMVWVGAVVFFPGSFEWLRAREGSAGTGAVSVLSGSALVVFTIGFAAGFYWTMVRAGMREAERQHQISRQVR